MVGWRCDNDAVLHQMKPKRISIVGKSQASHHRAVEKENTKVDFHVNKG